MLFARSCYPRLILALIGRGGYPPGRLPCCLEQVLPILGKVLVVLHHHLGARVPEKLRDLGDSHPLLQCVGHVGMTVDVGDDPPSSPDA